jgi:hypothetical protein
MKHGAENKGNLLLMRKKDFQKDNKQKESISKQKSRLLSKPAPLYNKTFIKLLQQLQ